MINDPERILVLAPHTDDGEFGCGGAMAKWIAEGKDVYYAAFSSAEASIPKALPANTLRDEIGQATSVLGLPKDNLLLMAYPVRHFLEYRQEILEKMVGFFEDIKPDLVLVPSDADTHQDHEVIAREGFRAFKRTSILGYEMPYNNRNFDSNFFVPLSQEDLDRKIKAIACYKSQFGRIFATDDFTRSLAAVRGAQVGTKYAEAFNVVRWIL